MDAIVIGGSIAGLMHAVVLKSLGRNVLVLEARSKEDLQARAAGLSLWPHAQKLIDIYVPEIDLDMVAIRNKTVQTMAGDGRLLAETSVPEDVRTSSWALVHRVLWKACEQRSDQDGTVSIEVEARVCGIDEQGSSVVVTYRGADRVEKRASANLVVAADGARSFVRSQVLSGVQPEYAGYLAWRGNLPEVLAPPELEGVLEGKLLMFKFPGSYVLA